MATQLEITLSNSVRQQADAYFRNNIGLYPTRSDVAFVLPSQIAASGEQLAFARNVINNMPTSNFCIRNLESGKIVDLCDTGLPEVQEPVVARLYKGSVVMDDVLNSCIDYNVISGCECNFSVVCNGLEGLSGTLYYTSVGTIDANCLCG